MGTSAATVYEVWAEFTYPDPAITSFTASKQLVTVGESVSLLAIFTGGNGIINGIAVTSGVPLVVTPSAPTTYVLTVQDITGQSSVVAAEILVDAVPTPQIISFTTPALTPLYGATPVVTPTFANGVATITGVAGPIESGQSYMLAAIVGAVVCTLTVTNPAGVVITSGLTLTPQVPAMSALAAAFALVNNNTTFAVVVTGISDPTLHWYVDGILGGNVDAGTILNGTYIAPASPGDHVIRATLAAYPSVFRDAIATVITAPSAVITVSNNNPLFGAAVTLRPTFVAGTAIEVMRPGVPSLSSPVYAGIASNAFDNPSNFTPETATELRLRNVNNNITSITNAKDAFGSWPTPTKTHLSRVAKMRFKCNQVTNGAGGLSYLSPVYTINAGLAWPQFMQGPTTPYYFSNGMASNYFVCSADIGAADLSQVSIGANSGVSRTGGIVDFSISDVWIEGSYALAGSASIGTYQGGSDVSTTPETNVTVTTPPVTAQTIYWLRVVGPLGNIVDATVLVTPKIVALSPLIPDSPTKSTSSVTAFSTIVTNAVNAGVTWTCSAGVIDAGGNWTAPTASGQVTITATSKADPTKSVSTVVTVVPVVTINSFTASPTTLSYGAASSLYVAFTGAASVSLTGGTLSCTVGSGQTVPTPTLTQTTTYTLTGTNAAGTITTQTVTVTVKPVQVSSISAQAAYVAAGHSIAFDAVVTDAVNTNILWSATGPDNSGSWNGNVWTAPATLGTYAIKATAAADNLTSKTFACNVVSMSLLPATMDVLYGEDVLLTPSFLGVGTVDHGIGSVTSGTSFNTGAVRAQTTFTLTVVPGDVVGFKSVITPATVVVSSIAPASPHITIDHQKQFASSVSGAFDPSITWSVDGIVGGNSGVGTISTGGLYTAPATVGFHEVRATSTADGVTHAAATVHIVPDPIATSLSVSTTNPLYGDTVLVSAYYSGAYATIGTSMGGSDIATTVYSSIEQGLDHGVAVTSAPIKVASKIWLRVFDEADDFVDTYVDVVPQVVTLTQIQPTNAKVSVGYTATFISYSNGAVDSSVTWECTDGSFSGSTWLAPAVPGVYTIFANAVDNQATVSAQVNAVPLVTEDLTALTNPTLYGGSTMLVPMFNGSSAVIDHGIGSVSNLVPVSSGPITVPTLFTLTVQNPAGQVATTSLLVSPLTVSVSPITPSAPTRMSRTFTRFSATITGAVDTGILWSCSAGSIDSTGKWVAPEIPTPVEIFASSSADPSKFTSTTVTVVSASIISAQVSALHPTRLELYINDFDGPLTSASEGPFDPRKHIDIYSGGSLVAPRSFSFDVPNNRYLIYFSDPLSYDTIVQVIHHLPSMPFHGADATELIPLNLPGFAIVATRVDQVESSTDVSVKAFFHVPEGYVQAGEVVLLFWDVANADHIVITGPNGFTTGPQPDKGELEIPGFNVTTPLVLTAYNAAGDVVGTGTSVIHM